MKQVFKIESAISRKSNKNKVRRYIYLNVLNSCFGSGFRPSVTHVTASISSDANMLALQIDDSSVLNCSAYIQEMPYISPLSVYVCLLLSHVYTSRCSIDLVLTLSERGGGGKKKTSYDAFL